MGNLTEAQVRNAQPGSKKKMSDGSVTGLWFVLGNKKGRGKWILKFTSPETGERREMGLGAFPEVGIEAARCSGREARGLIARGVDPIIWRDANEQKIKTDRQRKTFEEAAREKYKEKLPTWTNGKHTKQWITTLERYVFKEIGSRYVDTLKASDFAKCLMPIWNVKPETAIRVKQRCRDVMNWCFAHELIDNNPVDLALQILEKQKSKSEREKHRPYMAWQEVPKFKEEILDAGNDMTRCLLEFLIHTVARPGEVRGARWSEFDIENKVWIIPANRMKKRKIHKIPLSKRALQILEEQKKKNLHKELVFPSPRGKVLSDMVYTSFMKHHNVPSTEPEVIATAHGFRSSFRNWASEKGYSNDLAERALSHVVRNKTEAAYHRTDLFEERRPMMENWSEHIEGKTTSKKRKVRLN
jgi:integrase